MKKTIITILDRLQIAEWQLTEVREETAELFFVRRNLDMRRMKQVTKYYVTVFRDFVKEGKQMKGSSAVILVPSQTEEEVQTLLERAYFAASFVANPTYPLPEKTVAAPVIMNSDLRDIPLESAAVQMAGALFATEKEGGALYNSVEIFAEKKCSHLCTSRGTDECYTSFAVKGEFVVQCKTPEDVEMYRHFEYDTLDTAALAELGRLALERVADRAVAEQCLPSGNYDVILSDEQLETVLSYYRERTAAAMVYPGYSTWKVGESVQGENVQGEKLHVTAWAKSPFSDEGIPMRDEPLIEDGKVSKIHGGARFCAYLGIPATGNYSAVKCKNGTVAFADMKKKPYLYPVFFSDFQMDEMSGHFGGEIRLAYWFDGETVRVVTGGSVNGSIHECCGNLLFSKERYKSAEYDGPFAVRLQNIKVAGTV